MAILRTFSKAYGLAGLRCGYLLAEEAVARRIRRVGGPFRVGRPTRAAGHAGLMDPSHVDLVVRRTRDERQAFTRALQPLGLRVPDSHANFVMAHLGRPEQPVTARLALRGIRVRSLHDYGWPEALRITIGRAADNRRVASALAEVLGVISVSGDAGRFRARPAATQPGLS